MEQQPPSPPYEYTFLLPELQRPNKKEKKPDVSIFSNCCTRAKTQCYIL